VPPPAAGSLYLPSAQREIFALARHDLAPGVDLERHHAAATGVDCNVCTRSSRWMRSGAARIAALTPGNVEATEPAAA
jgi:hypothetical protein